MKLAAAAGATLIVQKQGGEVDGTMVGPTALPQLFAGDEPVTCNFSVSKPNYVTWTKGGGVPADRCGHAETLTLLARLVRSP